MRAEHRLKVYWDGQCPFCAAMSEKLRQFDTHDALELVDYNNPEIAATALPRFTFDDLNTEMHVLMPDGTWRIGYWAWVSVLETLPKFRSIATIMNYWILAEGGPQFYRWFASHRLEVSKLLGLPEPCGSSVACKIPQDMRTVAEAAH